MKVKKWDPTANSGNGAWVQDYPEVNVSSIVATGTPSSSTFLRGDGTWATTAGVDTNNYLTGVSGSGNGTVTFTRQGLTDLTFNAAHTHTEYLKYNPDGDGIAIAYDDSNPTINGQAVGGGHTFGADGSLTNGYLNAKVLLANGITNSVSGYYVGAMTPSSGGSSTQVVDGSGNWVGNVIAAAKLGSHTHAISDVTNLQTSLDGKLSTSGTAAEAYHLDIEDTRAALKLPNDYDDGRVSAEFTDDINGAWWSALTMKGWADGYAVWQLIGYSSTGEDNRLFFKNSHGANNTWSSLQEVWHSGSDGSGSGLDADLLDGQHGSYYAPIASPALTGTPTAPTATAGTNTTQIATTAFVSTAVANLINAAPGALDTLDELAAALGDDANFASTVTNALNAKANDNAVVKLTGNQTVAGVKTFSSDIYAPRFIANPSSGGNDTSGAWGIADYDDKLSAVRDYITDTYYPIYHTGNKPTATDVGLGNVTNESKATMFTSPTFTGTVSGVTASMVGLGNVTNESKATMFTNPTLTGNVSLSTSNSIALSSGTTSGNLTFNTAQTYNGPYLRGQVQDLYRGYYISTYKIWDEGNDGASSGLDADLLDGQHASAFAASSHTHTLANITDSGGAAAKNVTDSSSASALSSSDTNVPTVRDIYYGTPTINGSKTYTSSTNIYAPTSAGSSYQTLRSSGSGAPVWVESFEEIGSTSTTVNNYGSISFTSGMRNFYIEVQQDGTTGLYQVAKFMVTMENSYSLSTSSRYYRATWFNGGSALTITFQYYYSGTTFYIRHTGSTVTLGYRLYNVK